MKAPKLIATLIVGMSVTTLSLAEPAVASASAEQWLTLQRNQTLASSQPQAASALAREKSMERLFKTYDQAIPGQYFSNGFKAGD